MLSDLYIRNLAIIDEQSISFDEGLNILTGETGTGKSIIINAISLLCGSRSNTSYIGKRSDSAFVEGTFYLCDFELEILKENFLKLNLDIELEDNILVVSRTIGKNGRSVSKINNRTITNSSLSEIMINILNICSQHDSYTLFNKEDFVDVLDSFCDENFKSLLFEINRIYNQIKSTSVTVKNLKTKVNNFTQDVIDIKEID